jgi:acyl-homoserine-lactone acylase
MANTPSVHASRPALLLVLVAVLAASAGPRPSAAERTEILWDRYGIPHIFAPDRESMFYAHGWAQMHNQANLLLRLYGESRGRAAEYWGASNASNASNLDLDRWTQLNGVPERARAWYAAQDPAFRTYLDAFARGINDFAKANRASTSWNIRFVRCTTATWARAIG